MRWVKGVIFTILLVIGFVTVGYFYIDYTLQSPKRDKETVIEVPEDTSLKQIGQILKQKNLIRDDSFFRYYTFFRSKTNLIAGTYIIQPSDDIDKIINKISSGKQDLVTIEVPNGFDVEKIALRLSSKLNIKKEDFFKEVNRKEPRTNIEKEIPTKPGRVYKLEGYLMPAKYQFKKGATAQQVVDQMLNQFEKELEKLDYKNKLQEKKLSLDDWVTKASLVVKEGAVDKEYPMIAGVIDNRLTDTKREWKLQIDAAIVYAWALQGEKKERLMNKDLTIDSPYNIYENKGLPVGPIASPGEKALMAVLNPEKSNYFFYVAKNDGSNEHYFSETDAEHKKFIEKAKENAKKQQ
ncbi:endolytic transglycosylase MltG [Thermoactinomyces sp. DSM 45892]|uniref:endolytic transglycosylase MltG n=1 Tax=Thermoactinomyces sp. DSM 45892 TaxID=1882753 RepID=UPI00089B69A2|nr:endolytic transglycosylase MltG [Thermoactinomyces sp. DSM 45892]SDZ32136.1 UPF0755 protein [Thermoactinomyces sp. DSM 45892]